MPKVPRDIPTTRADFAEVITSNSLYVDKTKQIYDCFLGKEKYFFLARPRRFGKSLLCSTLRELFLGNKELFKGLWIEKSDWAWDKHPIIHLDMTLAAGTNNSLENMHEALRNQLKDVAVAYKIKIDATQTVNNIFGRTIHALHTKTKKPVVVIIDEYDKPILDLVDNPEERNRIHKELRDFYAPLKPLEKHLRFVFFTGVYKFTQTSIFSNLNNLQDLTFDRQAGTLIGYTEKELREFFAPEVSLLADKLKITVPQIVSQLREKYNGYSFGVDVDTGQLSERVYNSFAMNNVFAKLELVKKWFASGSPRFLIKKIEEGNFEPISAEGFEVPFDTLQTSCSPDDIDATSLMYYAGYATMQSFDAERERVRLGYPNLEVAQATASELMKLFKKGSPTVLYDLALDITQALQGHDFDALKELFNQALAQLTYQIIIPQERYFQTVILLIIQMGRLRAEADIPTNDGRMDIVIQLKNEIIIVELKFNLPAALGLQQIKDKDYAKKFRAEKKKLTAVGLSVQLKKKSSKTAKKAHTSVGPVVDVAWKTL